MDNRRFQELRDVYAQLSRQSTGAAAGIAGGLERSTSSSDAEAPAVRPGLSKAAGSTSPFRKGLTITTSGKGRGESSTSSATSSSSSGGGGVTLWAATGSSDSGNSSRRQGGVTVSDGTKSGDSISSSVRLPAAQPPLPAQPARSLTLHSPTSSPVDDDLLLSAGGQPSAIGAATPGADASATAAAPAAGAAAASTARPPEFIAARLLRREASARVAADATAVAAAVLKRDSSWEQGFGADEDAAGVAVVGGGGKRRRKGKRGERNSFYPRTYFEWTEELMAKELPERSTGAFIAAIFELGLKHSSPKVLMKLMPPKADRLTTEHIKSRLQKYRLHAHRSKEEFLEFFNLRLKTKFEEFLEKEGWRNLSPRHGHEEDDEWEHDRGRGEDGAAAAEAGFSDGGGGGGRGAVDGISGDALHFKVDGRAVGNVRDLGSRCVREQFHLQEVLKHHISAQLALQAEIHEHLTSAGTEGASDSRAERRADREKGEGCIGRDGGGGFDTQREDDEEDAEDGQQGGRREKRASAPVVHGNSADTRTSTATASTLEGGSCRRERAVVDQGPKHELS